MDDLFFFIIFFFQKLRFRKPHFLIMFSSFLDEHFAPFLNIFHLFNLMIFRNIFCVEIMLLKSPHNLQGMRCYPKRYYPIFGLLHVEITKWQSISPSFLPSCELRNKDFFCLISQDVFCIIVIRSAIRNYVGLDGYGVQIKVSYIC